MDKLLHLGCTLERSDMISCCRRGCNANLVISDYSFSHCLQCRMLSNQCKVIQDPIQSGGKKRKASNKTDIMPESHPRSRVRLAENASMQK